MGVDEGRDLLCYIYILHQESIVRLIPISILLALDVSLVENGEQLNLISWNYDSRID